ncbi:MAG: RNA recognition motif-containing protein [Icmadophila ericetorum]|nr:RNA recognition motif-containing protein [Icmadophila ericetorum]
MAPLEPRQKRRRILNDGNEAVLATDDLGAMPNPATEPPRKQGSHDPKSLFIRSLPPTATTETLTHFFSQSYPLKHVTVVLDPGTRLSKGYGFVTFVDAEDAQRAKEEFNGSVFEGRKIRVELAESRNRDGEARVVKRPRRNGQKDEPSPKLIIRNLPWSIKTPEQLSLLFRSYGKIKHADIPKLKTGLSAGFGFVTLRGRKNAEKALEGVNGKEVDGRTLAVDWAVEKQVWETLKKDDEDTKSEPGVDEGDVESDSDISTVKSEEDEDVVELSEVPSSDREGDEEDREEDENLSDEDDDRLLDEASKENILLKRASEADTTLFVRNLPFTSTDESLQTQFEPFGAVRYARVVIDPTTGRSRGTGFVCFYNAEDATSCLRNAPKPIDSTKMAPGEKKVKATPAVKHSLLENPQADSSGRYTTDGRTLQVTRAVNRDEAHRLTVEGSSLRDSRDRDKRRFFLLSEGTIPSTSPLYNSLAPSEIKMREDSAKQRQALMKSNPSLHISLTRLSIRNIPRHTTSKDLKALAREAVISFAKDVKEGLRQPLSKEEIWRGGLEMNGAEKIRRAKGKGVVKQAKIVFEGKEGGKVGEGEGRSRGYGFVEFASHRLALMGLRWLNGHTINPPKEQSKHQKNSDDRKKRLIAEFAIENAQVVARRAEKEAKARETSRLAVEKREAGETPKTGVNNDQARTKRKREIEGSLTQGSTSTSMAHVMADSEPSEIDKLARRTQIIGRKRMLRKAKRSMAS